jgi:hypothetical protein
MLQKEQKKMGEATHFCVGSPPIVVWKKYFSQIREEV